MSNEYTVYEDAKLKIGLGEQNGKFEISCYIKLDDDGPAMADTAKMTIDEALDLIVRILGPLYYFEPDASYMAQIRDKLNKLGYARDTSL